MQIPNVQRLQAWNVIRRSAVGQSPAVQREPRSCLIYRNPALRSPAGRERQDGLYEFRLCAR